MKKYWIKLVNLLFVIGILIGYNVILENRSQAEEMDRLEAELETVRQQMAKLEKHQTTKEESTDVSLYKDGIYEGKAQGFGGTIMVEVTVQRGVMTKCSITSAANEDRAYLESASTIVAVMLEQQTADVDTVSGATYSSMGIRNAVADALEQAKKEH